jgi:hypothetical protein
MRSEFNEVAWLETRRCCPNIHHLRDLERFDLRPRKLPSVKEKIARACSSKRVRLREAVLAVIIKLDK